MALKTKMALLAAGEHIFLAKGYHHTGIQEILESAGVPKGSFYHYFASKEDFGLQVIASFAKTQHLKLKHGLGNQTLSPLTRLRSYFEVNCQALEASEFRYGCLIGNLSQELADQSEAFRTQLDQIWATWQAQLAACLQQAQDQGEIPVTQNPLTLAAFCLSSWQGAVLQAKVTKNSVPLQAFMQILFGQLLY